MRRFGLVIAFVLGLIGLGATPSLAQSAADVPVCAGVNLLSPANGAVLETDYRVRFTWSGEPRGAATREWVSIRIDADKNGDFSIAEGTHAKAEKGAYKAFARGRPGIYTWFVLFKDAKGNIICMSKTRTYIVGDNESLASLMAQPDAPTVTVTYNKTLKRFVVVLNGNRGRTPSPYVGPADLIVSANDYDGSGAPPAGYDGLEIHGNNKDNKIKGSTGSDLIFGYAGSDIIDGNAGDDTINGGDETCFGFCGDIINGGDGNDTINGGNETCLGLCGDVIDGGKGNDTINGGDEACLALCGDTIVGGDGSDTIHGGAGTDLITGNLPGNVDDGDPDTGSGDAGADTIANRPGDTITQ